MKRIGNLYHLIYNTNNLVLADKKARRGKSNRKEIIKFDLDKKYNLLQIQNSLINKTFTTSAYHKFQVNDGKVRDVFRLPYKDRVVHHALMNILEPIFYRYFTTDTYSCITGRGIHRASYKLRKALKKGYKYVLKIDIKKFYPSISNDILKHQFRRKFKDRDLLWLIDNIIDSSNGQPIGNLTSQFFANFYLTPFDRFLKQKLGIEQLYRYCDDIVILANCKTYLRVILDKIKIYLTDNLKLELKSNYQIFPVKRGIDFLGYVHFPTHTKLRKSIKKRFVKTMFKDRNAHSVASYRGWLLHCNSTNLQKKYGLI